MITKKLTLVAAIGTAMGLNVTTTSTQAATLTSLVITGGTFAMGVITPAPNVITSFSGANLIAGAIAPTFDTTVAQPAPAASSPIAWDFSQGGVWANTFTTAPSSGDATGGTISGFIDITVNFTGASFVQSAAFTGSHTGTTSGTFDIGWTSLIVGGPFDSRTGTYTATGTFAAVPVPAAVWLMGSGLLGLIGIARRKKPA
jgi:hypothetical protein